MRERPILFSAPMVRAILAGTKTKTRRLYKPARGYPRSDGEVTPTSAERWTEWGPCPYGAPGDRLWVRETFYVNDYRYPNAPIDEMREALHYRAGHDCADWEAGCPCRDDEGRGAWRPSIHMPRWASRLTLQIDAVRAERPQEITEAGARAEGLEGVTDRADDGFSARHQFAALWEQINGDRASWASNPWVWVVTFHRVHP